MESLDLDAAVRDRADVLFQENRQRLFVRTDRLFAGLMLFQWLAAIGAASVVSPLTWDGATTRVHLHVWAAIVLGGAITILPVTLGFLRPGRVATRHVIAVNQMLMSALLIHLSGGRIETHFHVFGSLAFIGFYRDWKVFVPATTVVALDHFLRGMYWPESVYGVTSAPWRWLEHASWVLFEDVFLIDACLQSVREMRGIARQQAELESMNERTERTVQVRTAQLRTSEEKFRSLSAAAPIGIFQTDAHGAAVYFNARWGEIVGRATDDGIGNGWMSTVHPEDLPIALGQWESALAGGREAAAEFRTRRPDGEVRWVEVRTKPMRAADGTAIGHVGTVEDVSDRKQAEASREEEGRVSAALAHVGRELISSLETPVLLERLCRLAATVLGAAYSNTWLYRAEEGVYVAAAGFGLRDDQWEALKTIRLKAADFRVLLDALGRGDVLQLRRAELQHPILRRLFARHGAQVVACIPLLRAGAPIGIQIAAYQDAEGFTAERLRVARGLGPLASTALANAHSVEEIAEASRLKSEFVSTMSHELRTPLNVIVGYTDMATDETDPAARTQLLQQIRRASLELRDMVVATLDLGRIAAGKDEPSFETVALRQLWAELRADFAAIPRRPGVALRWSDPGDAAFRTDRRKLKAILKNLVDNALKFTLAGEVVVEGGRRDDAYVLSVRDTGVGIPRASFPYVFDMFRQGDSSETRSYGGAGLGLYIVRTLLEQIGGRIEFDSQVGRGSVFRVVVPRAGADGAAPTTSAAVAG